MPRSVAEVERLLRECVAGSRCACEAYRKLKEAQSPQDAEPQKPRVEIVSPHSAARGPVR